MKKMKKLLVVALTVVLSAGSLAAFPVKADSDDVKPTKVSIKKSKMTVYVGDEFEINAKTNPGDADDDYLRWKITKGSSYIKFDDDDRNDDEAEFVAKKAGTAKVKVWIKGTKKSDTITITVKNKSAKLTRSGKKARTVEVGDDIELKVKASGVSKKNLKWSIKNTSILKFDDGKYGKEVEVKGKKAGTTTVTCTNTKNKQKVTFTVTVKNNSSDYGDSNYGNSNYGSSDHGDSGYDD